MKSLLTPTTLEELLDSLGYEDTRDYETGRPQAKKLILGWVRRMIPTKWKKTRKTMLISCHNGELGFHTGSGFDHNKLTLGTFEEYGNSHYNQALSDIKENIKKG